MFQPETDPNQPFRDAFVAAVNAGLTKKRAEQTRRQYLGASMWGEPCARRLAYGYHQVPVDEGREFKGDTLRIFDMGHDCEARVAEYLRAAGFDLKTENSEGKQFGFSAAEGRLKGHIDGVILAGPALPGLTYPCLWENKGLNDKGWKDCVNKGVKKAKPLYYAQAQTYMTYKEVGVTLFTALNRNTGEIMAEVIHHNAKDAQEYSDRAVRVIQTTHPEELPRAGHDDTSYLCKWCDHRKRCWGIDVKPETPSDSKPSWLV